MDAHTIWQMILESIRVALSWPKALVVALCIFRAPLSSAIKNLSRVEAFGSALAFERQLAELETTVEQASPVSELQKGEQRDPSGLVPDRERPQSEISWDRPPNESSSQVGSIPLEPHPVETRQSHDVGDTQFTNEFNIRGVEHREPGRWKDRVSLTLLTESNPSAAILEAWEDLQLFIRTDVGAPDGNAAGVLAHDPRISEKFQKGLRELRELRNLVAHGSVRPTPGQAWTFAMAAYDLQAILEKAMRRVPLPSEQS